MKIKTVFLLLVVFLTTIIGQQRPRLGLDQFDADRIITNLTEKLSLSDEQVSEIKQVLLDTQSKLDELKSKSYDNDRDMMEEHRAVMDTNAELIEEHLTKEQIEIFRELRNQRQRFNKGDRPRMGRNRW